MAALIVAIAMMAVLMTAAMPVWKHMVQREKEEELVFRGEQYARAIALFYIKNSCTLPQDVDTLVSSHYLRKKWKDPVSNDDFNLIGGSSTSGQPIQAGQPFGPVQQNPQQGTGQVGISGVSPKSTATSIVVYNNQQQYSLWMFTYASALQKMGQSCQRGGQNNGRNGPAGQNGQQPRGPGGQTPPGGLTPPGGNGGRTGGSNGPGGLTPRPPGGGEQTPIGGGPVRPGGPGGAGSDF
ncbi:MAG: pilus assembly FimT family protein [Gemmatimonadaceae bacterium]